MPIRYNYRLSWAARELRRSQTDAENHLWASLRRRQLGGYKFQRQRPIGRYVVDFFCPEARLAVEVDGSQHFEHHQCKRDKRRTSHIMAMGVRVLRFDNRQVLLTTTEVLEEILNWLETQA